MQDLATRKLLLQQRSAVLRHVLAMQVNQTLAPALKVADHLQSGGRWLRGHPALVVAAAAALMVWRPRAILSVAGRGWWAWQAWQRLTQSRKN
ncbi:MAG TPA: YqjK family protein [Aquabacterium sp.]|nr:YqjK family protein [Aquabacterium sp.]